ncbi:MAG: phosphodiester glycosidase family protein [Bacteroidales bacterium]|nr:phosphodiester glycosidase family protein [Bacteroidales bacterium]
MKKHLLFLAMAAALSASATETWTLQDKTYYVDTLYHATVGPGVTQTSLQLSGAQALRVFYSTVDLTNPYIDLRATPASSTLKGGSTIPNMAAKWATDDLHFVSGVNADFFSDSTPIGMEVVDGQYYNAVGGSSWFYWGQTDDKTQYLGSVGFNGSVTKADGTSCTINSINGTRYENFLVLFNSHKGTNTGTNAYGTEVTVVPVDGATLTPGATFQARVTVPPTADGSMTIPSDGIVLSGHGTARTFLSDLQEGDLVTITSTFTYGGNDVALTQLAGGKPMILSGGVTLNTQDALDHLTSLNPRTAIGYDATGTKVVMLVVDGRTSISVGVVSKVLADIMREVGCSEALNFDGGGSSTMWTKMNGVENNPSDGSPRSVVNGVFAVSRTPKDDEIASIAFNDYVISVPKYGLYCPVINGFNKYGVYVGTVEAQLSCDPELGEIVDGGLHLLASGSGTHALTASYNGATATLAVTIGEGSPEFKRSSVLVDGTWDYAVEVQALVNGEYMTIANEALTWESLDPSIATVSDLGVVHGVANGTTTITGTVGDIVNTLQVVVEIPESQRMVVDEMNSLDGFTVTTSGVSTPEVTPLGDGGCNLAFNITSTRSTSIALAQEITFWSRPDQLELLLDSSTSSVEAVTFTYSCDGARNATVKVAPSDGRVLVDWADAFDTQTAEAYPLMLKKITLNITGSNGDACSVDLGALTAIYLNAAGVGSIGADRATSSDGPTVYYNLQGQRVDRLVPGQIYIRRVGTTATKILAR